MHLSSRANGTYIVVEQERQRIHCKENETKQHELHAPVLLRPPSPVLIVGLGRFCLGCVRSPPLGSWWTWGGYCPDVLCAHMLCKVLAADSAVAHVARHLPQVKWGAGGMRDFRAMISVASPHGRVRPNQGWALRQWGTTHGKQHHRACLNHGADVGCTDSRCADCNRSTAHNTNTPGGQSCSELGVLVNLGPIHKLKANLRFRLRLGMRCGLLLLLILPYPGGPTRRLCLEAHGHVTGGLPVS
jgi:hypothetical protein